MRDKCANDYPPTTGDNICQLNSLDLSTVTYFNDNGKTAVRANHNTPGGDIVIKGTTYESGVRTHADSKFVVKVNGATKFHAIIGIDDETGTNGNFDYNVFEKGEDGNTKSLATGTINASNRTANIDVDVNGWKYLYLETPNGSDGNNGSDHVDLANAYIVTATCNAQATSSKVML